MKSSTLCMPCSSILFVDFQFRQLSLLPRVSCTVTSLKVHLTQPHSTHPLNVHLITYSLSLLQTLLLSWTTAAFISILQSRSLLCLGKLWFLQQHYCYSYIYRGMCCKFLPPYSPDYNPIELLFSTMKYHLYHNGDYICFTMTELGENDIHTTLLEALYSVSLQDVFGWYRHCGYV